LQRKRKLLFYNWYVGKTKIYYFIHLMRHYNYKTIQQSTLFITKRMKEIDNV